MEHTIWIDGQPLVVSSTQLIAILRAWLTPGEEPRFLLTEKGEEAVDAWS